MLTLKIEKKIMESHPSDLIEWIRNNPNFIHQGRDVFLKRFSKLRLSQTKNTYGIDLISIKDFTNLIHVLFDEKESVTETEFILLEEAVKSVVLKGKETDNLSLLIAPGDIVGNPILSMVLLMLDSSLINDGFIQYSNALNNVAAVRLYRWIMDIYIPSYDSEEIISLFFRNFPIKDIIGNANNTSWFRDIYKEKELDKEMNIQESLLLFHYVSDIYSNRTQKVEFFFQLHKLFTGSYHTSIEFYKIADRYRHYFEDNTESISTEIMLIIKEEEPKDKIDEFLYTWSGQYFKTVTKDVLRCLMEDVFGFLSTHEDTQSYKSNFGMVMHDILENWNSPKYHQITTTDEVLLPGDKPITYLQSLSMESMIATEAVHKDSPKMNTAEKKIYKAYRTYKDAEEKVDSQITKGLIGIKNAVTGDVKSEIIEGKKFSAIGLLKQLLATVAIFSFGKIKAVVFFVTRYALRKKTSDAERRKILLELETEIELVKEKVNDAKSDQNREAKYALMRTLKELENAHKRIQYGLDADQKSLNKAKSMLSGAKNSYAGKIISGITGH